MKRIPVTTLIIGVVVVLILLAFPLRYQVRFNERAVRVHLGKADASSVKDEPGVYFRWPAPIDAVYKYDTRLQVLDATEGEIKTVDQKNVIVASYALWRVKDPLRLQRTSKNDRDVQSDMRNRLNQARGAVIGRRRLGDFVTLDEAAVQSAYDTVGKEILAMAGPGIEATYGIELVHVGIRRISLPDKVTQEVFRGMSAQREALAVTYRSSGQSTAEGIKARARAEADTIMRFAEARAQEIRSAGIKAATGILGQIRTEDVEFFELLRWLDALRAMFRQRTTIFLDEKFPGYQPFVNPPLESGAAERKPAGEQP